MPSMVSGTEFAAVLLAGTVGQPAIVSSQQKGARDDFWLAQINNAGLVINSQERPLDPDIARGIAEALRK
jgi:hypothetical protein